jgi:deoxyribonucleoside regulator
MQHSYSDDRLRLAARLYYDDQLDQWQVARFVKVSQAKVSRLLAMARERGIVRITVADYEPRRREIELELRDRLGLATAIVIKAIDGHARGDLRRAVGHFGSVTLAEMISAKNVIALAGGRTIFELVSHLPEPRDKALTVVQAMGSVDSKLSAFDAQEIGRVMAQRLGGTFLALNTPAFMPEKRTRDSLLELEQVRVIHDHISRANIAIVGVGTLENSVFVERGVLSGDDIVELRRAGAIGEICGRFIDAAGKECASPWRDRVMSAQVEQLRKIPQVIGVVSGDDRSAAILAAIRGRLLKGLIIDEAGAGALLATAASTRPAKTKRSKK